MKKYDESKDGLKVVPIETTKKGEFVRKVKRCIGCGGGGCIRCDNIGFETTSDKTYVRGDYDRPDFAFGFKGGYSLTDFEDVNRNVPHLRKGTLVLVGFSF